MAQATLDRVITGAVLEAMPSIVSTVKARIKTYFGGILDEATGDEATSGRRSRRARGKATAGKRAKAKRDYPPTCIWPDCKKPHKGPGSGFFCEDHKDKPQKERAKAKAAWKKAQEAAAGAAEKKA